jgi:hypothetical protein
MARSMAPRYVLDSTMAKVLELAANDGPSLERDASGIGDTLRAAAIDQAVGECQAAARTFLSATDSRRASPVRL